MAAYGDINCETVSTSTKDRIRDLYGKSKKDSEDLIKMWCQVERGGTAFAIRLPGVVGKDSHNNFISNLYKNIQSETQIKVFNRFAKFNNIIYINTLIQFIVELTAYNGTGYHNLLVASKSPITIEAIVKKMMKILNKKPIIIWENFGQPFLIDCSNSEKFGFKPIDTEKSIYNFLLDVDGSS